MRTIITMLGIAVLTLWVAVTQGTGAPVNTANTPNVQASPIHSYLQECQQWAYNEGEDGYPDSIIMHQLGCDDGPDASGVYERVDGRCNEAARRAYRNGYAFLSDGYFDYVESFGCEVMDDGSWIETK